MDNLLIVLIVLFVVLFLNGILAGNASDIAADKGYEKKFWFHMCFWLGPIAYIIVAGMPDRVMRNHIVQTNKLLTDLLNGQNIAPSGPTDLKQADISTILPEL